MASTATSSSQPENEVRYAFQGIAPSPTTRASTALPKRKLPYDVFINHRGPDVKHTLATSLYNVLCTVMGLRVFLDSEELELGECLPKEIEDAMQNASLHLAIFSENYAQSPWCLAELSFMVKSGAPIVPVFYHVKPDDVRYAKGVYANAFSRHEEKGRYSPEKLREWKKALHNVSYNIGHIVSDKEVLMDVLKDKRILGHVAKKRRVICALVVSLAAFAASIAAVAQESRRSICKRKRGEIPFYKHIVYSNETDCHDQIRMSRQAFFRLVDILRQKGSITNTMHLTLEEQLVMFLHTLGHNLRNRKIAHNFGHSGETISRYFHKVLTAVLALHENYLLPPGPHTPPEISGKDHFDPYFKDCVGAIDGTHIPVTIDVDMQAPYRDRKGNLSQNVMGVSSFDHKFQYVLAGWEGSAADSRVLASALSRSDPLVVPPGKYYLVDAGYPNVPGFLAPYHCTRYHLKEFSRANPINTPQELFNHRYSSLRNAIERTFGILKQRFPILRHVTSYQIRTQTKIVLACCILHNFITIEDGITFEVDIEEEDDREGIDVPILETYGMTQHDRDDWGRFRDEIAKRMWDNYRAPS